MNKTIQEFIDAYKNSPTAQKAVLHALVGSAAGGLALGGMSAMHGGDEKPEKKKKRVIRDAIIGAVGGAGIGGALPLGSALVNNIEVGTEDTGGLSGWFGKYVVDPIARPIRYNLATSTGALSSVGLNWKPLEVLNYAAREARDANTGMKWYASIKDAWKNKKNWHNPLNHRRGVPRRPGGPLGVSLWGPVLAGMIIDKAIAGDNEKAIFVRQKNEVRRKVQEARNK